MSKETITTRWLNNMAFEADVKGHKILLDAEPGVGGENMGIPPKPLMLVSL
jgi:putative redox protein